MQIKRIESVKDKAERLNIERKKQLVTLETELKKKQVDYRQNILKKSQEIVDLKKAFVSEKKSLAADYQQKINNVKDQTDKSIKEIKDQIVSVEEEKQQKIKEYEQKIDSLIREK